MKIAITGHRPNKLGNEYNYKGPYTDKIKSELQSIINIHKPSQIISGMALGVDTIWAILALKNNIPLLAAIPFEGQENMWINDSKKLYYRILNDPLTSKVIVSNGSYSANKMQIRNEYMVNSCDLLIAVWNGTNGGTANCVKYAQSINKNIIIINPKITE